jgi:SAM-dependent methyltransferase
MDHAEVGRYWDQNADTWTELTRAGYDIYRDLVNTPAFLAMLPDLTGRNGLDLGCGEGHNTRLLARRGARMTAVDIAGRFIDAAVAEERHRPLGIRYLHSSAVALPFHDGAFDFVVAFMSLMDMPDLASVLAEVHRGSQRRGPPQCRHRRIIPDVVDAAWHGQCRGHRRPGIIDVQRGDVVAAVADHEHPPSQSHVRQLGRRPARTVEAGHTERHPLPPADANRSSRPRPPTPTW